MVGTHPLHCQCPVNKTSGAVFPGVKLTKHPFILSAQGFCTCCFLCLQYSTACITSSLILLQMNPTLPLSLGFLSPGQISVSRFSEISLYRDYNKVSDNYICVSVSIWLIFRPTGYQVLTGGDTLTRLSMVHPAPDMVLGSRTKAGPSALGHRCLGQTLPPASRCMCVCVHLYTQTHTYIHNKSQWIWYSSLSCS